MSLTESTSTRQSSLTRAVVGPSLVVIGLLHCAFTPVFQPAFGRLVSAVVTGDKTASLAERYAQEAGFWYVVTGAGMLVIGGLAWWAERRIGRLPVVLGIALAALAFAGLLLGPVTGFWLFLVPAALVLLRRNKGQLTPA